LEARTTFHLKPDKKGVVRFAELDHSRKIRTPKQYEACDKYKILISLSQAPPFGRDCFRELLDLAWEDQGEYKKRNRNEAQWIE